MSDPRVAGALLGALFGAVAGGAVALTVSGTRQEAAQARLVLKQEMLAEQAALSARAMAAIAEVRPVGPELQELAAAIESVSADLLALRDAMRSELATVDGQLARLTERLDALAADAAAVAESLSGPLSEMALGEWAARSRDYPDPGGRFSALAILGRERSDIAVQASRARLRADGEDAMVLWQALQNLGRFQERAAAPEVAVHLDHPESVVRSAAHWALLRMGAPETDYDPLAEPEARRPGAAALTQWASADH